MGDSERPKPNAPSFEVPDLELDPAPRSLRKVTPAPMPQAQPQPQGQGGYGLPAMFDEDSFDTGSLSLELDPVPHGHTPAFGSAVSFEEPESFQLERVASAPAAQATPAAQTERIAYGQGARAAWPTGRAPDLAQLKIDPAEAAILADYGEIPKAIQLTPGYAYRVFTRQRELKRQLVSLAAESERAHLEREATLAELARAVRPEAERIEQFRRFFAPLIELEQVASQRGQALSTINAQLNAQSSQFDGDLTQIAAQISAQQQLEQDALRSHDERDAAAKRADAKLKRVHIEVRAVTQVAEQKLGPQGGQIPDAEAAQLATLRQRAEAIKPEAAQAQAELDQAKHALGQVRAQLDALRQTERQTTRKKTALGEHYQKEILVRSQGLSESEIEQRAKLADIGRAVLAAGGSVDVPNQWLERVRNVSERADKLLIRSELQRRAINAYDQVRVAQGVRLACTVLALGIVLVVLKIAL